MRFHEFGLVILLAMAAPVAPVKADEDGLVYSNRQTEICLANAGDLSVAKDCIGASANACMEATPGGYSTYGMGGCISRELTYWDDRLNASYRAAMARAKSDDRDMGAGENGPPSQAVALRDMQRAWIPFRDATCGWEYSKWGGGTGGGPAMAGCLMRMTGEQTLVLEAQSTGY